VELSAVLLIAVGLSMDAFAVSLINGLCASKSRLRYALKVGLFFGVFQGFMTWAGYMLGSTFSATIQSFDHWVAFILLVIIGGKMFYEGLQPKDLSCDIHQEKDTKSLLYFSVATSIDALAVGVSFAFLAQPIVITSLIIAGVTFTLSLIGVLIGKRCAVWLDNKAELLGGLVLIAIGVKILVDHLMR